MNLDEVERIIDQLHHALDHLPPDQRDAIDLGVGLLGRLIERLREQLRQEREAGVRALCRVESLRRRWRRHRKRVRAFRTAASALARLERFDPVGMARAETGGATPAGLPQDGIARLLGRRA